jgi:hypothetical protein
MFTYLIIAGLLFISSTIVFFVFNSGNVYAKSKRTFFTLLLFGFVIALPSLIGMMDSVIFTTWWFILLQVVYLGLGIGFNHLISKGFYGHLKQPWLSNLALLVANASIGYIGFTLAFDYFNGDEIGHLYGMSILLFLLPYLLMQAFEMMLAIPTAIHKVWYYPVNEEEPDFDNIDLSKIFFIELEFTKSPSESESGNYKARAPLDMLFKDWFRSFINNYNYKFEEDPIQYLNGDNEPHGWIFFTKPTMMQSKKFVDPDLTIKNNKLNEKTIVVAKRVGMEEL